MIAIVNEDDYLYKEMIKPYIGMEIDVIELGETKSTVLLTGYPWIIDNRCFTIIEE